MSTTITELWTNNRDSFKNKSLSQILTFCGDGKLRDNGETSAEFRELIDIIPSQMIEAFADNCLSEKFEYSGLALQDVVNQVGKRLGYQVENGLYQGTAKKVGHDGLWTFKDGHSLVIEVKTTDAYRMNLDTIAKYRQKLIESGKVDPGKSSILIVVGRKDTGDLEAQIRGSRHAWDIRLISTDSLLNLLRLKENLNDSKTLQQITELLKPKEYTRIDELIGLIFQTSQDSKLDEVEESDSEHEEGGIKQTKKFVPVSFYEECIENIENKLKIHLIRQSRIEYADKEKKLGLICSISKPHKVGRNKCYWFAFHPHQKEYLAEYENAYVCYGCGSADKIFMIPYTEFLTYVDKMGITVREKRMYWHVKIHENAGRYLLVQTENGKGNYVDITDFKI